MLIYDTCQQYICQMQEHLEEPNPSVHLHDDMNGLSSCMMLLSCLISDTYIG